MTAVKRGGCLIKYIVIVPDGMADYPIKELGGRTPLQAANTPNMDKLARQARVGMVKTVPDGLPPGSDVANLSVMGYDPDVYYTGRSPLEAASMGVPLGASDVAFRCNLVTLSDEPEYAQKTMVDYSSEEISSEESRELIQEVNRRLGSQEIEFYPGVSYRHLMVWRGGCSEVDLTPPHDISDQKITDYLPKGPGSDIILRLMTESNKFLADLPVNQDRLRRGQRPATSLWFWGQGRKPAMTKFIDKYQLTGSVIAAVDLTKGLGVCAGLTVVDVPGVTGNIHTNFQGKAEAALAELKRGQDFVYVHVEAPDEAGHQGDLATKVKAIEEIDAKVLGVILEGLREYDDYKILITPDHPTPLSLKTHVAEDVPFLLYQKTRPVNSGVDRYDEDSARSTGIKVEQGYRLMDYLIKE